MKKALCVLTILLLLPVCAQAGIPDMKFHRLDTRHGLSNSQVNCVYQDSRGYVWVCTPFGLCRYDGYRFHNFYSYEKDTTTLRNNRVDDIQEAADGRLWLNHGMNYSVYDPVTERVDRNPSLWLSKQGIVGGIERLYIDSKKNFWVKTYDNGFFFFNPTKKTLKHIPFGYGEQEFPKEFGISAFSETPKGMVMVSTMGQLLCLDGEKGTVVWRDDFVARSQNTYNDYWVYTDKDDARWVITHSAVTYVYSPQEQRWYTSLPELMRAKGFENVPDEIVVWEVRYDAHGYLWVATDHLGVLVLDFKNKEWRQFIAQKGDDTSLPDITARHLYVDRQGRMWVSTYKNGVAMSADVTAQFVSLPLGDINAACEDSEGYYWLGLNSGGIRKVDPATREVVAEYDKQALGVPSAVIVAAYAAKDGTLWFGTWEGGLLRYRNGAWTSYRVGMPGTALTTNNVWAITEDYWGNIWVGVLGGGVMRIDKQTGAQRVFNEANSKLSTNWTNSIGRAANGWILVGNSIYGSIINPKTMKIINLAEPHDEKTFTISLATTQAVWDERGLLWQGSPSGLSIYDRRRGQSRLLDMRSGFYGSSVSALLEDARHTMWVVTDHGVSNVIPQQGDDGQWTFTVRSYNDRDGLQPGPFNQRAIWYTRTGHILIGGQDGLDIIDTNQLGESRRKEKPLFSGLQIFDQDVAVGEEVDGRTILHEALDVCRELTLKFNDQFTIQLASTSGEIRNRTRFVYRLDGFNDNWVKTSELNPNITYNSLRAGSYTLHVRMLNDDGTIGEEEAQMDITILPPLWRTRWMVLLYMVLIAIAALLWRRWFLKRQTRRMKVETARRELEKQQWMNEMRQHMANERQEHAGTADSAMPQEETLTANCTTTDLVGFVRQLCDDYVSPVADRHVRIHFLSSVKELAADVDTGQFSEMLHILFRNAAMFSVDSCQISVGVACTQDNKAQLQVADNGIGIKDEYKEHAFDPMAEGEGIGLDHVKAVVTAHDGDIRIEDNPGGGTIFVITFPLSQEGIEEAVLMDD